MGLVAGGTAAVLTAALLVALVVAPGAGSSVRVHRSSTSGASSRTGPFGSVRLIASSGRSSVSELASDEEAFALALTQRELSGAPDANVLLSPMSADVDLSMLELGAGGATEREIAAALRATGLSTGTNAAAWEDLLASELADESPGELTIADSLWVKRRLHIEASFLHAEAAAFGNDTYQVDFASPSATNAINAWVDRATAGRISKLFAPGELSPTTVVVLANALHLHAAWTNRHQFSEASGPFVTAGGDRLSVPTLSATDDQLGYAVRPSYDAVQIPYTNGRFAALVIEPKARNIASWLAGLDPSGLASIVSSLAQGTVDLSMPALDLSARPLLNTPLSAMGMANAFLSSDLAPMLGPSLGHRVALAQVQQADTLQVDRWGTDAAAATGISVVPTALRAHVVDIDVQHPYLFVVRDTKTGVVLFSSVVNDPAGS